MPMKYPNLRRNLLYITKPRSFAYGYVQPLNFAARFFYLRCARFSHFNALRCSSSCSVVRFYGATAHGVRPRHEAQEQRAHDGTSR